MYFSWLIKMKLWLRLISVSLFCGERTTWLQGIKKKKIICTQLLHIILCYFSVASYHTLSFSCFILSFVVFRLLHTILCCLSVYFEQKYASYVPFSLWLSFLFLLTTFTFLLSNKLMHAAVWRIRVAWVCVCARACVCSCVRACVCTGWSVSLVVLWWPCVVDVTLKPRTNLPCLSLSSPSQHRRCV